MSIEFKSPRIRDEFTKLFDQNRKLWCLIDDLGTWVKKTYNKDVTLTHIWRSQAEHNALYAATDLLKRPASSPHMRWQAVDIRSYDFDDDELKAIVKWINDNYKNPNGRVVAFAHAIAGGAFHVHIQYKI